MVELWGLGDLVIATPFLQAVAERYSVTLLAKPYAVDVQPRLWPGVEVVPFVAPWTAFTRKYELWAWNWRELFRVRHELIARRFSVGLSARWDPRDHLLLRAVRARMRLGFPRVHSEFWLTKTVARPSPDSHRYENWRVLARALGFELPPKERLVMPRTSHGRKVLVHTGAGQPVRVWALGRYRQLVAALREKGYQVQVACDVDQRTWWLSAGEASVATPRAVKELLTLVDEAAAFIGNDSGPGHLAAFCGVPTLTIFGPQVADLFVPLHPAAELIDGKPCPFKPCSDYCQFPRPYCLENHSLGEVLAHAEAFLRRVAFAIPGQVI